MTFLEKIISAVTVVSSIGGTALYMDDKHADKLETKAALVKKVDAKVVADLQKTIIFGEIDKLEDETFDLEQIQQPTQHQLYRLTKKKQRLQMYRQEISKLP